MENTAFSLAQATADDPASARFLANYEMGQLLGIGAFSEVREAVDRRSGERVAIKVIDRQHSREDNVSVDVEIAILKRVRHPNIIALYDVHEGRSKIFLVMELVTGGELFDRIVEKGRFTESDAARIVGKILEAVDYLHKAGIAHRDLKPENLLLSDPSDQARVMISDFGLSKMMSNEELMKTACGTPGYVAPEVLSYVGYGKEVDLWSTGVIAYVLLCGYAPFFGEKDAELFAAIMNANFEFDSPYWDNISDEAKDFISRLLVIDSRKRYTSEQALQHSWIKKALHSGDDEVNLQPTFKSHLYSHPNSKKPVDARAAIEASLDMQRQAAESGASSSPARPPAPAAAKTPSSPPSAKKSAHKQRASKQDSDESTASNTSLSPAASLTAKPKQASMSSLHVPDAGNGGGDDTPITRSRQSSSASSSSTKKTADNTAPMRKNSSAPESFLGRSLNLVSALTGTALSGGSNSPEASATDDLTTLPANYYAHPGVEEGKLIRVLSFNIFLRPPLIKNSASDYKDLRLAYFIDNELNRFDIIGLQEMFNYGSTRQDRLIEAARKLGIAHHLRSPPRSLLQGKIDGGLLLLSRYPIVKSSVYKYSRGVFSDRLIAKGALYGRIELAPGRHVHVFVTHLQTSVLRPDGAGEMELCSLLRQQQLRFLKEFMLDETAGCRATEPVLLLAAMEIDGRVSSRSGKDSDEYLTMMEILQGTDGSSAPMAVIDLLKESYGEHPVTCGDTDELGQPREAVLTNKELQGVRGRFDYVFWTPPSGSNPTAASIAAPQAGADRDKHTKAEPFFISGEKVTQLSDNYGISTTLFLPNLQRRSTSASVASEARRLSSRSSEQSE